MWFLKKRMRTHHTKAEIRNNDYEYFVTEWYPANICTNTIYSKQFLLFLNQKFLEWIVLTYWNLRYSIDICNSITRPTGHQPSTNPATVVKWCGQHVKNKGKWNLSFYTAAFWAPKILRPTLIYSVMLFLLQPSIFWLGFVRQQRPWTLVSPHWTK